MKYFIIEYETYQYNKKIPFFFFLNRFFEVDECILLKLRYVLNTLY